MAEEDSELILDPAGEPDLALTGEDLSLPWEDFARSVLRLRLFESKTSIRIGALRGFCSKLRTEEPPEGMIPPLVDLLVKTIPKYHDPASRRYALEALKTLFGVAAKLAQNSLDNMCCKSVVKLLEKELKGVLAARPASVLFVYVKWCVSVIRMVVASDTKLLPDLGAVEKSPSWIGLFSVLSNVADAIGSSGSPRASSFLRRAVQQISSLTVGVKDEIVDLYLRTLLTPAAVDGKEGPQRIIVIGAITQTKSETVAQHTPNILKFFVKAVLSSRSAVLQETVKPLATFVGAHVTAEHFQAEVMGSAERLLLRSPEIVIAALNPFMAAISFDPSAFLADKFADSMLNHMKSTNDVVKTEAQTLFQTLASKSRDEGKMIHVLDIVVKAFSAKSPTVDQRQYYYNAIRDLPALSSLSKKVIEILPAMAAKESSAPVVTAALLALVPHISGYLTLDIREKSVVSSIAKLLSAGIKDAKAPNRLGYSHILQAAITRDGFGSLSKDDFVLLLDSAVSVLDKFHAAGPIALLDPKKDTPAVSEGYFAAKIVLEAATWERASGGSTIASYLEQKSVFAKLFDSKSFLLNERLYSKLVSYDEQLALLKIALLLLQNESWFTAVSSTQLASAALYPLIQSNLPAVQQASFRLLSELAKSSADDVLYRIFRVVRIGLGAFLLHLEQQDASLKSEICAWGDRPPKSSKEFGHWAFAALCAIVPKCDLECSSPKTRPVVEKELVELAVLANHPVIANIMGSDVWIRLCFRGGFIHPRQLVEAHALECINKWIKGGLASTDLTEGGLGTDVSVQFRKATLSAISLFTAAAPAAVLPALLPHTLGLLDNETIRKFSAVDVEIWKTPEGQLYVDPLKRSGSGVVDDRPRNADEKWERELRKELDAKKKASTTKPAQVGAKGKASDPKQAKLEREIQQAQLEKEAAIRAEVGAASWKINRAIDVLESILCGVVESVGEEAREVFENWLPSVLSALLNGVIVREQVYADERSRRAMFVGARAFTLLALAGRATGSKLEEFVDPPVLAMTICRAIGVHEGEHSLDHRWCVGDLAQGISDVFKRLRSTIELSGRLDPASFTFVFPLIRTVALREGKIQSLKERAITDLSMSVADLLFAHAALGSSVAIPRQFFAKSTISLMANYPKLHKASREALLAFCTSIEASGDDIDEADDEDGSLAEIDRTVEGKDALFRADLEGVTRELLDGLLSPEPVVREACLLALAHLQVPESSEDIFDARVWITRFDSREVIAKEANSLWEQWNGDLDCGEESIPLIVEMITHKVKDIRESSGRSLCAVLREYPEAVGLTLNQLYDIYQLKAVLPAPEYDEYGMIIPESLNKEDEWGARAGIASALKACAPVLVELDVLKAMLRFLIEGEALGDRHEDVRQAMLDAGLTAVNTTGKDHVRDLLEVFESYLDKPAVPNEVHDRIRESVVILLGTLAQHLDASDPIIPVVVDKLIETLRTPSEMVQIAVSECLPALIKLIKDEVPRLLDSLLDELFNSPKYAARRGAAYGLAGVVKGRGISALKDYDIMGQLRDAVEDKKNPQRREGACFGYEALSQALGRLFEPYVIQILPLLLVCYGDNSREVREATHDACKVIMSKLSAHCVKLVLPSLLDGLDDRAWRTKHGSIEVLGSMAFLAPKQLALSLPTIVPRLCDVLADSHAKVQEAAKLALTRFGGVIKNPEIQTLVPDLLAALVDPNSKTQKALVALLDTAFVHYIDAPSLALVVPILNRGLKERSTETKKKAAQIMGSMASLTEQKDLVPYLPLLMPGLKEVLIDPVPEARAIAAKALGSMVEKLGEENFPGLVSELIQTLKTETSSVDRSGASQGLSEVLAGLGLERLEGMLPEILAHTNSARAHIREGFMTLLIYLPATYGDRFQPYLDRIVPPILRGLADDSETIREAALKAGRMIIRNYATNAIDLLLPQLEKGLFDDNWRIRLSSVSLMGDLLYRLTGINANSVIEGDDETYGTENSRRILVDSLGKTRYEGVLASIYIVISDVHGLVRQSSLHVWKAIVTNTPRTLKDILPVLMSLVISLLGSDSFEKRSVAARTLGELVRKLGENILAEIIPILEHGLESDDANTRQGVCIGMSEIMGSAGKMQVADFGLQIVPAIRRALVDPEPDVREAAAQAFDVLHQHLGSKAIDDVLPYLLNEMTTSTASSENYALGALKEIMAVRSNVVFPVLIPALITEPITAFNARALGSLISVAGSALTRRLNVILPALMSGLEQKDDAVPDIKEALKVLMLSVEEDGLHTLMVLLQDTMADGSLERKRTVCEALAIFCAGSSVDISDYVSDWVRRLLELLTSKDAATVKTAWAALDALIKTIKKDEMERHVANTRRAIAFISERLKPDETIAGFSLPKGISPLLPIFSQGLIAGSNSDVREQAALGLGDLVRRTSVPALGPFVTQITGPLIRVIGDRFPWQVKAAILQTLSLLLVKVPALLKPFLPQLQRTFVKSLSEPSSSTVRERAASCLSTLIGLQTRLDPLVVELTQGVKTAEDRGVRDAMWQAILGLLKGVGPGREISAASQKTVADLVLDALLSSNENEESLRTRAARCFGVLLGIFSDDDARDTLEGRILSVSASEPWHKIHGAAVGLEAVFVENPSKIADLNLVSETVDAVAKWVTHEKSPVAEAAVHSIGSLLTHEGYADAEIAGTLVPLLVENVAATRPSDVRRETLVVLKNVAKLQHGAVAPFLGTMVPALMTTVRDRTIPVKLAGERALVYLLQIKTGTDVLQKYLGTLDGPTARSIGDYARRVLVKIGEKDSDDEADDS
ncbi:armadillo-type protein [Polychytrium aggregatum]|uniref:armadillo-type protein n=1 Tax=Polychytrium aggregatum TaxID=110093 RepID=UPI0022FDBB52|nr:armadillo-type protein [Polychytrium aggregatum]KAI9203244.1 armadillo-type protein [Polychytrium aggregatum]